MHVRFSLLLLPVAAAGPGLRGFAPSLPGATMCARLRASPYQSTRAPITLDTYGERQSIPIALVSLNLPEYRKEDENTLANCENGVNVVLWLVALKTEEALPHESTLPLISPRSTVLMPRVKAVRSQTRNPNPKKTTVQEVKNNCKMTRSFKKNYRTTSCEQCSCSLPRCRFGRAPPPLHTRTQHTVTLLYCWTWTG